MLEHNAVAGEDTPRDFRLKWCTLELIGKINSSGRTSSPFMMND
jgi:hypothetical protein